MANAHTSIDWLAKDGLEQVEHRSRERTSQRQSLVRRRVLAVLNADLAPWKFDGSEPMCLALFEAIEAPVELQSTSAIGDTESTA